MQKAPVALAAALVLTGIASAAGSARAQSPETAPSRTYKAQPLNLQKGQRQGAAYAGTARSRARAGDCAGALDVFDAAIREQADDMTLYRDRGMCHETLGHPYPAIDDYRVYLTATPEAPDAAGIRQRLTRLEEQTSGRPAGTTLSDDTDVPSAKGSVSVSMSEGQASATATSHDKLEYVDNDREDLLRSPLRRGKGFSLGAFFSEHKFFFTDHSFGDGQTWAECVGVAFRYSFSRSGALLVEAAYAHFNGTGIDEYRSSGLSSQVAYEIRLPLDPDYDNQLLVDPGVGYEHLILTPNDPAIAAIAANAVVPRIRFGWRHMVTADSELNVSADFGVAFLAYTNDTSSTVAVAGLNLGLAWGL